MAENTDIMIEVDADIAKALKNIKELETSLKTTKSTIDNQLKPSTDSMGGKISGLGGKLSNFGNTLQQKIGIQGVMAFTAIGAACTKFAKDCVSSAMTAEKEWGRFGAIVNSNGGNWEQESARTKKWAKQLSNNCGYAVSDTRNAMMSLAQMGVKTGAEMETAMYGVAGVAARTGQTEEEAASMVISALTGRANQLAKMTGLRIEDYKTADGQIDRERLLKDLYEQNKGAIESHANTTEAQIQRINNSWASFKAGIGQALMPVVKVIADVAQVVVNAFTNMPSGVQTFIAVLIGLGAVIGTVIGALGFLAPVFTTLGGAITAIGGVIGTISGVLSTVTAGFLGLASGGLSITGILGGLGASVMGLLAPLSGILIPLAAIIAAFGALYLIGASLGWWDSLGDMIGKIGSALSSAAGMVGKFLGVFSPLTSAIGDFLGWIITLFTDFPTAMSQASNTISNLSSMIMGAFSSILGGLGGILGDLVNVGVEAVGGLVDGFISGLSGLGDTLRSYLSDIPGIISEALSNLGASVVPGGGLTEGILAIVAPLPTLLYGVFKRLAPMVLPAVSEFIRNVVSAFGDIARGILEAFLNIPGMIVTAFTGIVATISQWLGQARMIAGLLVQMLIQSVVNRFNLMVARVRMIWQMVVTAISTRLNNARTIASNLTNMIRNAIVNNFNRITARVRAIFGNIVNAIRSRLTSAVSQAKSKAQAIYQGIKDKVSNIPQMVKDEFDKIKEKIKTALDNAKRTAVSCINDLVSSVKSALGIASPGFIQRMFTYEFTSIPGIINTNGGTAIEAAGNVASGIVDSWNNNFETLSVPYESIQDTILPSVLDNNPFNYENIRDVIIPELVNNNPFSLGQQELLETRNNPLTAPIVRPQPVNNTSNNTSNLNTTNITVEQITLECGELTQAQSRRVLYNALQGLNTGGV